MRRLQILFLLLISAILSACERSPTASQRTGAAEIALTTAAGTVQLPRAQAGALVYSPGPTPDTRSYYLVFTAGDIANVGIEVEFSQNLPSNQDLPNPGTYIVGVSGPMRVAYGSSLLWRGGKFQQYVAYSGPSSLTIETATPERITGRFTIEETHEYTKERVTVSGTFSADQVVEFADLPRLVGH
ncbi:hypothetical protein [Longimicrobium sp.]|jgi:hypothetical protein|uniref:hypothetical protein n=1 Tax=Longimicrobium sp. TaxID=2029185 RepID=UPI002ED7E51B